MIKASFRSSRFPLMLVQIFILLGVMTTPRTVGATGNASDSKNDQAAVSAMQDALSSLGGSDAWKSIRTAHARMTVKDGNSTRTLLLMDDWSTSSTRYRRGFVGESKQPNDHAGGKFTVMLNGRYQIIREFDQAHVLAEYMPGAAIETILRRPDYVVRSAGSYNCGVEQVCVFVYHKSFIATPCQIWTFSSTTHLPIKVTVSVPELMHGGNLWEQISFSEYMAQSGVLMPSTITVGMRGAFRVKTMTLQAMSMNGAYDANHFDSELRK